MLVEKLLLSNFRVYKKRELDLQKGCSIIVGPNAVGKSAILEAITVLSTARSFRKAKDDDLVNFEAEYYYIQSIVKKKDEKIKIAVSYDKKNKVVFKNEKPLKKISDFISCLFVVNFSVFDFSLINGAPHDRRKFLNLLASQVQIENIYVLNEYEKLLKERNIILKKIKISKTKKMIDLLRVITIQLIEKGKKIISFRTQLIDSINSQINDQFLKLTSDEKSKIKIEYLPSVFVNDYEKNMEAYFDEDVDKGSTFFGPHKDDFYILLDSKKINIAGSQGQQRDALLSLKFVTVKMLEEVYGESPVLLLDDVFSELDSIRQNNIIKNIDKENQTIITTTSLSDIDKEVLSTANIIELK